MLIDAIEAADTCTSIYGNLHTPACQPTFLLASLQHFPISPLASFPIAISLSGSVKVNTGTARNHLDSRELYTFIVANAEDVRK